jgi:hypothetical protein
MPFQGLLSAHTIGYLGEFATKLKIAYRGSKLNFCPPMAASYIKPPFE